MRIRTSTRVLLDPQVLGRSAQELIIYVSGTLGGATPTLQYQDEGENWIDLENGILAIDTQNKVECGIGASIYLEVTGASGTTDIYVTTRGMT